MENNIAVIDMDSVAYAMASDIRQTNRFGASLKDENGKTIYKPRDHDNIRENCQAVMTNILNDCDAEYYIGFIKGINGGQHRYNIKPDYKAHRPKVRPEWWQFTSDYITQNFNVFEVNDLEVDDVVNVYRLNRPNTFIVAVDKDLLELEGTHFNWTKKSWQTNTKEEEIRNFWKDMIAGQFGDGVKGIQGKGEAYASKVLKDLSLERLPHQVLHEYINIMPDGITEFSKNYVCLKILEQFNGQEQFLSLDPIKCKNVELDFDILF